VVGRIVESTLYDITGDFAHQSTKLYFLGTSVKGNRADTTLKSHEYSTDYLRSLVRRGSSRIDYIAKVTTRDNFVTMVSIVAFARGRVNASQEHAIRAVMRRTHTCGELTQKAIGSKVILSGWVHARRDHGGLTFIDLRDRYGFTQIVFDPKSSKQAHELAYNLRREDVIDVEGAEADDIIGTLVPRHIMHEDILIISSTGIMSGRCNSASNQRTSQKSFTPTTNLRSERPSVWHSSISSSPARSRT
jgi:hypothetical protein